jgi:hypothetical protein
MVASSAPPRPKAAGTTRTTLLGCLGHLQVAAAVGSRGLNCRDESAGATRAPRLSLGHCLSSRPVPLPCASSLAQRGAPAARRARARPGGRRPMRRSPAGRVHQSLAAGRRAPHVVVRAGLLGGDPLLSLVLGLCGASHRLRGPAGAVRVFRARRGAVRCGQPGAAPRQGSMSTVQPFRWPKGKACGRRDAARKCAPAPAPTWRSRSRWRRPSSNCSCAASAARRASWPAASSAAAPRAAACQWKAAIEVGGHGLGPTSWLPRHRETAPTPALTLCMHTRFPMRVCAPWRPSAGTRRKGCGPRPAASGTPLLRGPASGPAAA